MPGVDLEMAWELRIEGGLRRGRTAGYGIGTADWSSPAPARWWRWCGKVDERVEGVETVEELEMEGGGSLAIDGCSHGHVLGLFMA